MPSDGSVIEASRRIKAAHLTARLVWRHLPGPVARPNYGWYCPRHDSTHRGSNYRAVDGELVCPDAVNAQLSTYATDGGSRD